MSPSRSPTELLRALADHISAMVAYWDSSLRCRFANRAYQRWFGVSPEALIGTHIRDLLGPLYERNLPYIEGALRGERQEFEREIPDPSGGPPRQSLAEYIPDVVDGVVCGFFVLVTDISRVKEAEQALRDSEARFSGIVSSSADAIVSVDDDLRIVVFNEGAEEIFGWSRDEVLGRPLEVLVAERFRADHAERLRRFADGDGPSRRMAGEIFGRRKSGAEFPAEATVSKLRTTKGLLLTVSLRDITERRRIEDERRVFVALLENSSDFIGIADANGTPIYVNPAGRRMVGLPPDLPVEKTTIPEYYPPEERAFARDVIVASMVERGQWSGETYFRNWQTGEAIPVSDEHFMIRDPSTGRVLGMGTVTRDISKARAAYAQLREAEERFRLTIDEAPIGMAIVALDGRFVRVNRALCEIVGYTPEELVGLTFQAITHPDDLDVDLALAKQLLNGEVPRYQLGKRYIRKDGAVVDVLLSGSVLRGPDGAPIHFIAQIEDVTERKRAEAADRFLGEISAALSESLAYERTLKTLAGLAVRDFADLCIIDLAEDDEQVRRVEVASRDPARAELCTRLAELPLDRSRPHLFRSVLETKQPLFVPHVTEDALASFAQNEEHLALLRSFDMRSVITVPLVAHGELLGAIAFATSTSPRPYDETDLRLAGDIAERAARAIENARLYRTARRATQARDDVLGIVAHDLRSPLGIVLMQASALRRRARGDASPESGPRSRTPAEVIERAANRMNRLIQDLLDVTRIDAKRLRIEPASVSSDRLVADVVEAHRPVAAAAAVELRTEIAPDLPEIWGDRDRLLQAFENLLGNALKFTDAGGVVTVGAARRNGEVLFWVKDSGAGIAADDVPHVFDRFWQAGNRARRGAGLGLPIVKGIVDAHHGPIWVESTLGRGSTFFFTVPTAQRVLASRDTVTSAAP